MTPPQFRQQVPTPGSQMFMQTQLVTNNPEVVNIPMHTEEYNFLQDIIEKARKDPSQIASCKDALFNKLSGYVEHSRPTSIAGESVEMITEPVQKAPAKKSKKAQKIVEEPVQDVVPETSKAITRAQKGKEAAPKKVDKAKGSKKAIKSKTDQPAVSAKSKVIKKDEKPDAKSSKTTIQLQKGTKFGSKQVQRSKAQKKKEQHDDRL